MIRHFSKSSEIGATGLHYAAGHRKRNKHIGRLARCLEASVLVAGVLRMSMVLKVFPFVYLFFLPCGNWELGTAHTKKAAHQTLGNKISSSEHTHEQWDAVVKPKVQETSI